MLLLSFLFIKLNNDDGILKNAAIVAPLKNLRSFWRSFEMVMIN